MILHNRIFNKYNILHILKNIRCKTYLIESFSSAIAIAIVATCPHNQSLGSCHVSVQKVVVKVWEAFCLYKRGRSAYSSIIRCVTFLHVYTASYKYSECWLV